MTTTATATVQDWLTQAEAEYDAAQATYTASERQYALDLAKEVNDRLAQLGITPVTPATVDRHSLVPALLVPADTARRHYGVHASFDEDEGRVELLASDHRPAGTGAFVDVRATAYHLAHITDPADARRNVILARHNGPRAERPAPPQCSADALVIIRALGSLQSAVEGLADAVTRGLSRP